MAIQAEVCPSCGAPIEFPEDIQGNTQGNTQGNAHSKINRTKCPYCSASLSLTSANSPAVGGQKIENVRIGYSTSLLHLLFSFNERLTRKQFWLGFGVVCGMVYLTALFVKTFIDSNLSSTPVESNDSPPSIANAIASLLYLVTLWIFLAVHIKRLRDRGKAGWWTALWLVPFGFLWVLYEAGVRKS